MIGLIYADYKDPDLKDGFHSLACATFRSLSMQYGDSVDAVTDPYVTSDALERLLCMSDFIFYWGHAEGSKIIGSAHSERLDIPRLGGALREKIIYIDGCKIGMWIKETDFPDSLVIGPTISVPYDVSVYMGCSLVLELLGNKRDFREAFELAKARHEGGAPYSLVGLGRPNKVTVSDQARLGILSAFFEILLAWKSNTGVRSLGTGHG